MKDLTRNESPDRVHGRLLESVHVSGYTCERACGELKWLLRQDRWKMVSPGFDDIDEFLATMDLAQFRMVREERKDLVRQLEAVRAGQRATARLLGVGLGTVQRDLATDPNGSLPSEDTASSNSGPCENAQDLTARTDPNGSLPSLTPYYSDGGISIYHGDCREILPALALKGGLMVTDPPYNVDYHYDQHDDALEESAYWNLLHAVLRMPLVVIHYPEATYRLATRFRRAPDKVIAWVYHANTPRQWRAVAWFGTAPDLTLDHQPYRNPTDKRVRALMAAGRTARLYDWWEIEQVKNVSDEKWGHPCQIPMKLMRRLLRVTPSAGPIIDPFCGAGTTLLAAQELGREAIGIECSEEYCEIAKLRLQQRPLALTS